MEEGGRSQEEVEDSQGFESYLLLPHHTPIVVDTRPAQAHNRGASTRGARSGPNLNRLLTHLYALRRNQPFSCSRLPTRRPIFGYPCVQGATV